MPRNGEAISGKETRETYAKQRATKLNRIQTRGLTGKTKQPERDGRCARQLMERSMLLGKANHGYGKEYVVRGS
jgi:hypothetical protein